MSNHFHISIQIKSISDIQDYISKLDEENLTAALKSLKKLDLENLSSDELVINNLICDQFKRFFTSYTRSFNNAYNRKGSLFRQKFKRSHFDPELKFRYLQYYIHHNARKHNVVNDFKSYPHTSYHSIVNDTPSIINAHKTFEWFDNIDEFVSFHEATHYEDVFQSIDLDEFI